MRVKDRTPLINQGIACQYLLQVLRLYRDRGLNYSAFKFIKKEFRRVTSRSKRMYHLSQLLVI